MTATSSLSTAAVVRDHWFLVALVVAPRNDTTRLLATNGTRDCDRGRRSPSRRLLARCGRHFHVDRPRCLEPGPVAQPLCSARVMIAASAAGKEGAMTSTDQVR